jgi:hypothetical protein
MPFSFHGIEDLDYGCLGYDTLKIEAESFCEIVVTTYHTTWCHNAEEHNPNQCKLC